MTRVVLAWVNVASALSYENVIGSMYRAPSVHRSLSLPMTPTCAPKPLALPLRRARPNSVPAAMPSWPKVTAGVVAVAAAATCEDRSSDWFSSTDECPKIGPPPTDHLSLIWYATFGWM